MGRGISISMTSARLSLELENLALQAAAEEYDQLNYSLFRNRLRRPPLSWAESHTTLGAWTAMPAGISLSVSLLTRHNWVTLVEVLKHEMAHQFVSEVLGKTDETAHGPAFAKVCADRGIDARAAGNPAADSGVADHAIDKIRRLLALAESANQHEAEAAMAAAQRLMLKYNLEEVQRNEVRNFVVAHLGEPTGRVQESQRVLAGILRKFFFVEVLWISVWRPREAKRGSILEVCGTKPNVEMAEYVHAFLTQGAERLWKQHKLARDISHDRDRRKFHAGVMSGFYKKLDSERAPRALEGLVWSGDAQLQAHFKTRYPKTTTSHYSSSSGTEAHSAGRAAGQNLVLHRGIQQGSSNASKLLGG
jgi:hypothetical protein